MEREGDGLRSVSLSDQVLEHYGRGERVKKRGAKASLRRLLFPGCGRRSSEQTETDETLFRQCGRKSQLTKHGLTKQQHLAPEPAGGRVHARLPCIRREKTSSESARRRGKARGGDEERRKEKGCVRKQEGRWVGRKSSRPWPPAGWPVTSAEPWAAAIAVLSELKDWARSEVMANGSVSSLQLRETFRLE